LSLLFAVIIAAIRQKLHLSRCPDLPSQLYLDNAVTAMRDDSGQRIKERGTVIEFMGGEQVYIVVTEQPEEIIKSKSSA
jgi:hypothetical protein